MSGPPHRRTAVRGLVEGWLHKRPVTHPNQSHWAGGGTGLRGGRSFGPIFQTPPPPPGSMAPEEHQTGPQGVGGGGGSGYPNI